MTIIRRIIIAILLVGVGCAPLFLAPTSPVQAGSALPPGCAVTGDNSGPTGAPTDGSTFVVYVQCSNSDDCANANSAVEASMSLHGAFQIECSGPNSTVVPNNPVGGPPPLNTQPKTTTKNVLPSCSGETCDGVDPSTTSCGDDAYDISSKTAEVGGQSWGNLELRYSPSCNANWVRFTPWGGHVAVFNGLSIGQVAGKPWIWRQGVANSLRGYINNSPLDGLTVTYWTSMVTADGIACFSVDVFSYNGDFQDSPVGPSLKELLTGEQKPDASTTWASDIGTYNAPCSS